MRFKHLGSTVVLAGALSLVSIVPAFADSSITTTGPHSTNTVTNSETTTITTNNSNHVTVTNTNSQSASTGNAQVSSNTTAGNATTGNASNSNNAATTVAIGNSTPPGVGSGSSSGSSGGTGSGASAGSGSSSAPAKASLAKAVALTPGSGSATVAMLPETGCSVVCDVSALRAAYKPYGGATTTALKDANQTSGFFMVLAVVLSLVAAGGTALYTTKHQVKA